MMIKVCLHFIQAKANLKITNLLLNILGSKAFSIDQKSVISNTPNSMLNSPFSQKTNQLRLPHRAETWEQKSTQLANILTILKFGGGNMGIGEHSLFSSQPLSISSSCWLWVEVSDLCCFYAFFSISVLAFWFLSC